MNKPLNFIDADGQAKGLVIDVFSHIAKQEGWNVTFAPCKWAECLDRLESGEIDVLSAIGYTQKRAKTYDFTKATLITNWGLVVTQPNTTIQSLPDLEGLTIAVMKKAGHTTALQALLKKFNVTAQYLVVDSFKSVFQAVSDKKADAGVVNRLFASEFIHDYRVLKSSIIYNPIEIRYAFTKGKHLEIVQVVDSYLQKMRVTKGSVYFQSLERWFGGDNRTYSDFEVEKVIYITSAFVISIGIILLLTRIIGIRYPSLVYNIPEARLRFHWVFGIAIMVSGLIFVFDLMLPLGVAGGVPYVVLVLIGYGFRKTQYIYALAIIGSALTVAGYFYSPPGSVLWVVMLNRGLALFAIWITAFLLVLYKGTENRLLKSDTRLKKSQSFANIGTWDRDIQNGDLFWSDRISFLFGGVKEGKETSYGTFLNAIHPDDLVMVENAINSCIENDEDFDIDYRVVWPDGTIRWLREKGDVTRDKNGKALHMLSIVIDVTNHYLHEQELTLARDEADRANKAKSTFLSSMSHELRTPLNAIIGFSQMLQYNPNEKLSESQNESIDIVVQSGQHLLQLIDQVLDLARVEAEKTDISIVNVNLAEVCHECQIMIEVIADEQNIRLFYPDLSNELRTIRADALHLRQVLLNLISNAIKYNREGGSITVNFSVINDGMLRINVIDTGLGIPKDRQKDLFRPFSRLGAETTKIEGTGLGLSITHKLVHLMGGEIGCDSQINVGSTFWVEFPLVSISEIPNWTETMCIGIDAIDKDHQHLFLLLERLLDQASGIDDVEETIKELIDYTHYHFCREEAVMEACRFPDLETHCALHESLAVQLRDLGGAWRKDHSPESLNHLRTFLRQWLFGHIMNVDSKISEYTMGKDQDIKEALEASQYRPVLQPEHLQARETNT